MEKSSSGFLVRGELNFDNLSALCQQGEALLRFCASDKKICVVDFSDMQEFNASALALMLAWFRFAKQHDVSLTFTRLSISLQRMLETFGLTQLLPID